MALAARICTSYSKYVGFPICNSVQGRLLVQPAKWFAILHLDYRHYYWSMIYILFVRPSIGAKSSIVIKKDMRPT